MLMVNQIPKSIDGIINVGRKEGDENSNDVQTIKNI